MAAGIRGFFMVWAMLSSAHAASAQHVVNDARTGGLQAFRRPPSSRIGDALAVSAAIREWVNAHKNKELTVSLAERDPAFGAYVGCPVGVLCDEAFDYRAFVYRGQGVQLRLSFDAAIAKEISLPLLQKHFSVASLSYSPEELAFANWSVWSSGNMVFRSGSPDLVISGFVDGRVQGEIKTEVTSIIGSQVGCAPNDAPMPPGCIVSATTKNKLRIKFDFPLPTGPLDCRGKDRPEFCG